MQWSSDLRCLPRQTNLAPSPVEEAESIYHQRGPSFSTLKMPSRTGVVGFIIIPSLEPQPIELSTRDEQDTSR